MDTPQSGAPGAAPSKSNRKFLWVILGIVAFIVLCIIAFAAFGFYFVSQNVNMERATRTEADRAFDEARARFKEVPIISIDGQRQVTLARRPPDQPAATKPTMMYVMAYDTDDSQIVRVTIPFWMLRLGREKIRLGSGGDLEFEDLEVTAEELERYGPALLVDHRDREGKRVLVWTQ